MSDLLVTEGPGVQVFRHVTHHLFFFGHYDSDLEEREVEPQERFDPWQLTWPKGAILLRVMHRVVKVRRIWGEEFPGQMEALKSRCVYPRREALIVTSAKALRAQRRKLRDHDGAERFLSLGHIEGIVIDPDANTWAKLRQGEHPAGGWPGPMRP